jgi:hypothetical protein
VNRPEPRKPSRRSLLLAGGAGVAVLGVGRILSGSQGPVVVPEHPLGSTEPSAATDTATTGRGDVVFDLSQPARSLLSNVRLHEVRRPLQGLAFDIVNQRLFIAQQRDDRPGADLCINRLSLTGDVISHLHVDNAGHGQSFGVEPVGSTSYLWLEWNANENTTDGRGTEIARFPFSPGRPGEKRTFFDAGVEVGCSIDPVNRRILIRRPEEGRTFFTLYDLDDADDGFRTPLARIPEPDLSPRPGQSILQAFTVLGSHLYTLVGTGGHAGTSDDPFDTYLSAIHLETGDVTQQELVAAGQSLIFREPEGLAINVVNDAPQLCFGLASRPAKDSPLRRANLFCLDRLL